MKKKLQIVLEGIMVVMLLAVMYEAYQLRKSIREYKDQVIESNKK